MLSPGRRHRIVTTRAQGMTAPEAAQSQPRSAPEAVRCQRIKRVLRTGRIEATTRPEQWAERQLVGADQETGERAHEIAILCQSPSNESRKREFVTACTPLRAPTTISSAGSSA